MPRQPLPLPNTTRRQRGFEVWLAVDHHYLPVRIRFIEKNGTVLDSNATAISYQ